MGLRTKLALFEKGNYRKRSYGIKRKENQRIKLSFDQTERGGACSFAEKAWRKWIGEKKEYRKALTLKDGNGEEN